MAYRPGRQLTSVEDARAMLSVHGEPVMRVERVAIDAADQRVLARDLVASHDVPRFARSMMDGFAVRAADTAGATGGQPARLRLLETIYTGRTPTSLGGRGHLRGHRDGRPAARRRRRGGHRRTDVTRGERGPVSPPPWHRASTSDARAATWWPAKSPSPTARCCRPHGLASSPRSGFDAVDVYQRPRVAILSTGDEIVAPGGRLGPAQIFDSNTTALSAAIRLHGGEPVVAARVGDDREALTAAFERCLDEDMVLFSGGTSVGERDFLLEIIAAAGVVHFEGLQLKPGKPTVFATVAGRPVFGMPGNPVSCLTNAYLLVAPLLRRMAHLPPATERVVLARLASEVESPAAGIRFTRSAWMAPQPSRCSRDRARSPAWRTPTDTSRYRRMSNRWKQEQWWK